MSGEEDNGTSPDAAAAAAKRKTKQISLRDYFTKRQKMSTSSQGGADDGTTATDENDTENRRNILASAVEKRIKNIAPTNPLLQESEAEKRSVAIITKNISKNNHNTPSDNGRTSDDSVDSVSSLTKDLSILKNFNRKTSCSNHLSKLTPRNNHTILFRPDLLPDTPPEPYPDQYRDRWHKDYVRMPCSVENLYPTPNKKIQKRWELIESTLLQTFKTSADLGEAILVYNHHYKDKWNFETWSSYVDIHLNEEERDDLLSNLLPSMANLALQLPYIVTQPPRLLQRGMSHDLTLSQKQASCLLANAFFCTFPRRNSLKSSEYSSYPDINFSKLFRGIKDVVNTVKTEKLKTILNYFRRVLAHTPTGTITYSRKVLREEDTRHWESCVEKLCEVCTISDGTIEDTGQGFLQVDFANRMIGGGVVGEGCVQEEIRFLICPELILSRLFTEKLEPNEALHITGVERFSSYSGYASSYKYQGNYEDQTLRDQWGRLLTEVVAIDAHVFHCYSDQFRPFSLKRELDKAYCGFFDQHNRERFLLPAVATGNWGCGAFGGDKHLKALLQIMAASVARRELIYFTFYDETFSQELTEMHAFLKDQRDVSVGSLWKALLKYGKELKNRENHIQLFPYLRTYFMAPTPTRENDDSSDSCLDIEDSRVEMRGVPCEIPEDMAPLSPEYAADTP